MPEEKAHMVSLSRPFLAKAPREVIKEALELFISYSGDHQQGDFEWRREITFADGEIRESRDEQDFLFHYGKPDIAALFQVYLPSKATLTIYYTKNIGYDVTSVGVRLPSREHIDNILELFSRVEERLNTQRGKEPISGSSSEPSPTGTQRQILVDFEAVGKSTMMFSDTLRLLIGRLYCKIR